MEPPPNVEVHDDPSSTWWIDQQGILCSISKKNPPEEPREVGLRRLEEFKRLTGGKKLCMLVDITHARPTKKEDRDLAAEEISKLVKAIAMVTHSALGRMVINLFFGLKPPTYPAKIFDNEKEARKWLQQYL